MRKYANRNGARATAASCGTLTVVEDDGGGGGGIPGSSWDVYAPTLVSASEPLQAGSTVSLRAEATNNSDDSETLVIDGSEVTGGTKESRVVVNGTHVATITFRAELGTTVSTTFEVSVPEAQDMTVGVSGATTTFQVQAPEAGDLQLGGVDVSVENGVVGDDLSVSAEIMCTGGPNDDQCPEEQFSVEYDGQTIKSEAVGPWNIARTDSINAAATLNSAGKKNLTVRLGPETREFTVTVVEDGSDDTGGVEPEPGLSPLLVGGGLLVAGFAAYKASGGGR